MAANLGRTVTFTWGGTPVEGVQEKGVTIAGEAIDISDDDSDGWRELFAQAGERTVDISISGVTKDARFLADLFAGTIQREVVITRADGSTITGTFNLVSTGETHPYKGATTFEASLQSSGEISYDPVSS